MTIGMATWSYVSRIINSTLIGDKIPLSINKGWFLGIYRFRGIYSEGKQFKKINKIRKSLSRAFFPGGKYCSPDTIEHLIAGKLNHIATQTT